MGFDLEVYGSVLLRESQVTFPHTKTSTHTNTKQVRGEKLDVNYNNIRHSVFQPCKKELTVILHFNLKNPILINKKKHTNVQFYTEVVEKSLALKKSKRSMYDPDEIDEEQRERKLKRKLNELFKKFQLRVNAMLERIGKETIEFDVPYRNLAFQGTLSTVRACHFQPTEENCAPTPTHTHTHTHSNNNRYTTQRDGDDDAVYTLSCESPRLPSLCVESGRYRSCTF